MKKSIGLKLLPAAACLLVWGCFQVDNNSENAARNSSSFNASTSFVNKITAAQKSVVLAKAASVAKTQDCATTLTSCSSAAATTYTSCLTANAGTGTASAACGTTYATQAQTCNAQYTSCLGSGTGGTTGGGTTGGSSVTGLPAACASLDHAEDISALTPCFQALGICPGFISILTDLMSCHDCDANPPASVAKLTTCAVGSGIDISEEQDPLNLFTNSDLNTCICGAGGGTLLGNLLQTTFQTTFNASSSHTAGGSFSASSSHTAEETFNAASSTPAEGTFNAASSNVAESHFNP